MKILSKLLPIVVCAAIMLSLTSCDVLTGVLGSLGSTEDGTDEPCKDGHSYSDEWSKDSEVHWHAATCEHSELRADEAAHEYVEGACTCGATEPVAPHEHSYIAEITAPTCKTAGYTT